MELSVLVHGRIGNELSHRMDQDTAGSHDRRTVLLRGVALQLYIRYRVKETWPR